nr:phosphoribosyltransferase [Legionella brunensis]
MGDLIKKSSYQFDTVVAIARGGFPAARFICDFLNIRVLGAVQITHYGSGAKQKERIVITAPVNIPIKGKKVLMIDDVNDTGYTLKAAHEYLQTLQPSLLKIAVLHEKSTTIFKADFTARHQIKWKWLIYQWAVTEDILAFLKKDNMLDVPVAVARKHLEEKYKLKISKNLFQQILSMKGNYLE